jgi:competence protein ComEA
MPLAPAPTAPAPPANAAEEPPAALSEPPAVVEQTLAPISAEEALGEPAEHEPQAAHEQTLAPVAAEEISDVEAAPASLVNVNTAELQALIDLPGIGPALAARIITYREQNGDFATVEQLVDVQGIGPNNMNEFRHLITV